MELLKISEIQLSYLDKLNKMFVVEVSGWLSEISNVKKTHCFPNIFKGGDVEDFAIDRETHVGEFASIITIN